MPPMTGTSVASVARFSTVASSTHAIAADIAGVTAPIACAQTLGFSLSY